MVKDIDIICNTMHKSGIPLSEDQRAIMAGCLAVLFDKEKYMQMAIEAVGDLDELEKKYDECTSALGKQYLRGHIERTRKAKEAIKRLQRINKEVTALKK